MRLALAGVLALILSSGPSPVAAASATPPGPCAQYSGTTICSGQVASFDQTSLDVDLTLPAAGSGSRHPLIVMLHGFGNDKHEWESLTDDADPNNPDKWHWNSHWFAEHGFYVLAYTARGFTTLAAGKHQPATPAGSSASLPNGTEHLKSVEFEVRDTEYLAGLIAAAHPDLDPLRVAVTGGSYGGGESWLLASQAEWKAYDPNHPLQLQVAIPKYPWTDLAYSLAPSGHPGGPEPSLYESSTGVAGDPEARGNPLGVVKESYTSGFYLEGKARGIEEDGTTTTPSQEVAQDGPMSIDAWYARAEVQGDPYDLGGAEDPIVRAIRRGLTVFRGSYYQTAGWAAERAKREVAVFSISGWTDDLFPPVESFRQYKYLKRLDPLWPVAVATADVGHPLAQNRPETWHSLNQQAWRFLASNIGGSHRQGTGVSSQPTTCGSAVSTASLTASTPEGLAAGTLSVQYLGPGSLTAASGAADPNGPATDPVAGGLVPDLSQPGCRKSPGAVVGAYSATSQPLAQTLTYLGLGYVRLSYSFSGLTAPVDARLWDVAPDGTAYLVSRGTYRIDPFYETSTTLQLPLFGNHWVFQAGHSLRIDLLEQDNSMFRRTSAGDNVLTFAPPLLVLPTHEAGAVTLSGS